LSDGQKVRKKSTAKVQVQKVSGGKKGTTVASFKEKVTTKKKKKQKSSLAKMNELQEGEKFCLYKAFTISPFIDTFFLYFIILLYINSIKKIMSIIGKV